jgi:ABC-type glycerol-3-phosphate transport system substrate-binding protein
MVYSGPWLRQRCAARGLLSAIGAMPPPGPAFIGGSNLVIWKHSAQADAAVKLVRFLTQTEHQQVYSQRAGLLPVRIAALEADLYRDDPYWRVAVECLSKGRSFPIIRLWGLVEDRLSSAFAGVWSDVLSEPGTDPLVPLRKHLGPLAARLDAILKQ